MLLAFDQALDWGWGDPRIVGLICASVLLLVSFAFVERRAGGKALVPRDVIGNREFALTCLVILLMSAVFFASLLYLPQAMEKVLGMSPIDAGLGLLPLMGVFAAVSFIAGPLYEKLGPKALLSFGALCLTAGPLLISLLVHEQTYAALVPGMVITGLGVGVFYPTATTVGVTSLDESRSSLAGAIIYMFQIAGGAIGLGLTTTILTEAARGGSFTDGLEAAFRLDAGIAFAGLMVAVLFLGRRARQSSA
jgi:fucose permease